MRVVDLRERESRLFPRSELFGPDGKSLILSQTHKYGAVDLRETATGSELRVLGLVGFLPLTSSLFLNIQPKFPVGNLWDMLEVAGESFERVLPLLRGYSREHLKAPHLLLARTFCHYANEILVSGVARSYATKMYEGTYRPRVSFGSTIRRFAARGDDLHTVSDIHIRSPLLKVNSFLKAGAVSFLDILPQTVEWTRERAVLRDLLNALGLVPLRHMAQGDGKAFREAPVWSRPAYEGALSAYSMYLGHSSVGFRYDAEGAALPSFLFNLDNVFEHYIRNQLRASLRVNGISIVDGNYVRPQIPLFKDNKKFPTKPDLIFRQNRNIIGLGEVKYKPRIEESDRYQLISHVVAAGARTGFWVSPAQDGNEGLEYIGSIASGAKFFHYRIDLSSQLSASAGHMANSILHQLVS